ncbi:MAG: TatD family hydrolase [bacterium]|nr:TatD family hydrolase [bacterium]
MVDSHVHLNHENFEGDIADVLSRAREAGVTGLVNIGFDLASSKETAELVAGDTMFFGAVGVHPHDAETFDSDVEQQIEKLLGRDRIVAVGEIGLDFHYDNSPRDVQRDVFRRQIDMARWNDRPIIIHCRDAFDDVMQVLDEAGGSYRGIFHAYTGDAKQAAQVLALGFHIGIGGVVTFKKSTLSEVVADLPADRIVLETDSPYLTPAPFRGKRNEPSYLTHIVKKISEVTGRSGEKIRKETDENVVRALGVSI